MKVILSVNEVFLLSEVLASWVAKLRSELTNCDSDDSDFVSEEFNEVIVLYSKILSYL